MSKKSRRVAKARRALFTLSLVLVMMMVAVGGTVAWLTSNGGTVTNTFSVGDITIELWESEYKPNTTPAITDDLDINSKVTSNTNYKIVPGVDLPKDPYVVVKADSEASWVFIKVEKENWSTKLGYTIDANKQTGMETAWTFLKTEDEADIYYAKVDATTADTKLNILTDKVIDVSDLIVKGEFTNDNKPVLKFTAYACQQANVEDQNTAWGYAKTASATSK